MTTSLYNRHAYATSIVRLYTSGHSIRSIVSILQSDYGVLMSREAVRRMLNSRGVSTNRAVSGHRTTTCAVCHRTYSISRAKFRESMGTGKSTGRHKPWNHYCDWTCFRIYHEETGASQQEARRMVAGIIGQPLPPDAVCHFVDDDHSNVLKSNIRVYTSRARHLQEHGK